jgi:single-strand DNA-binding protein
MVDATMGSNPSASTMSVVTYLPTREYHSIQQGKEPAMPDNTITIVGNVTRDPELRFTSSGQAATSFGLAVNRRWQNRQTQEWEEAVSFFDVTCWRDLAENVAETVAKGARLIVTGRLEQRSWETDDGERRSRTEVVADEVGPSLRWATAEVTNNDRKGNSQSDPATGPARRAQHPSRGRTSARRQPAAAAASGNGQADSYRGEPF